MTKQERPGVGIAAIVIKDNKVLFGKRKKQNGLNTWHFPGGHIEMGESFAATAIRETKEETDVDIEFIKVLSVSNDIHDDGQHYVTIWTLNKYKSGEAKDMEPDKAEAWDWYEWSELPKPFFISVANFIKQDINPFEENEIN